MGTSTFIHLFKDNAGEMMEHSNPVFTVHCYGQRTDSELLEL